MLFKNGRECGEDLARFLSNGGQWMVWTQLPLGSVLWDKPGVVDVMAVLKSFSNTSVRIYEVKISRSDFHADINKGKYERYLNHCTQFHFATPSGLIKKEEIPESCGLITCTEPGSWRVLKSGRRYEFKWGEDLLLKLLMRGFDEHFPKMRQLTRETFEAQQDVSWLARERGHQLAKKLAAAEDYIAEAEEAQRRIDEALGESHEDLGKGIWGLKNSVAELLSQRRYAKDAIELATITMRLFEGRYVYPDGVARTLRTIANNLSPESSGD